MRGWSGYCHLSFATVDTSTMLTCTVNLLYGNLCPMYRTVVRQECSRAANFETAAWTRPLEILDGWMDGWMDVTKTRDDGHGQTPHPNWWTDTPTLEDIITMLSAKRTDIHQVEPIGYRRTRVAGSTWKSGGIEKQERSAGQSVR
jgi:hypothetical protein